MKNKYLFAIVINLLVVLGVFCLFIFLDTLTVKEAGKTNEVVQTVAANTNSVNYNFNRISHFRWSPDHYNDLNTLNSATNLNLPGDMAFYSLREAYYRFEIIRLVLRTRSGQKPQNAFVRVYSGTNAVPCFSGGTNLYFRNTTNRGEYVASWFQGWRPTVGEYRAVLYLNGREAGSSGFRIIGRKPVTFSKTLTLIDLEWNQTILNRTIFNHRAEKVGFLDGLLDWMDYGEIDAFMTLSGETTGWGNITPETPWEYYPVKNLQAIGQELHRRNKLVGAYIMCFYTPKDGWLKGGYEQARGAVGDYVTGSRFVSFRDNKRFQDIVKLAKYFDSLPYVDFIGFDFIRFGELVGYENVDEFVRDMNVDVPGDWEKYRENDRIVWLGRMLKVNNSVIQRWKVWIAHKTADFIYRVRKEGGIRKPVWVFTLGWDHGTEHGQDPVFFQDAGVFADFVMLYESTPDMFREMQKSWSEYLSRETLNYIPGNQIDTVVNRSLAGRNPVEEYTWRLNTAVDYAAYRSRGAFIHDITRAFWGRKGNYPYNEWLNAGFASVSYNRWKNGEIPFRIVIPENNPVVRSGGKYVVPVSVEFSPSEIGQLTGRKLVLSMARNNYEKIIDISGLSNIIIPIETNPVEGTILYFALKGKIEGYPAYFTFKYIRTPQGRGNNQMQE